jgi:hypothetical protein
MDSNTNRNSKNINFDKWYSRPLDTNKKRIKARGSTLLPSIHNHCGCTPKNHPTILGEGGLKHPLVTDQTCHVIQYADDTLILKQGCPNQARLLKEILDAFSMTNGLS